MSANKARFIAVLTDQYAQLFETAEYALARARYTPAAMAEKMTDGVVDGSANKDGDGIKRTCKALGIKHTYKAIGEYLNAA
jgi:hypothetical protein